MKQAIIFCGLGEPLSMNDKLPIFLMKFGYKVEIFDSLKLCVDRMNFEMINNVDLIVGISLGGIWAPILANNFPNAKLILAGPFLSDINDSDLISKLFKQINNIRTIRLLNLMKNINVEVIAWFMLKINKIPKNCDVEGRAEYRQQMIKNIKYCKKLSMVEVLSSIEFVKNINNKKLLSKLHNNTLIIVGKYDEFCPISVALLHSKLIKNSKTVISTGGHYNVIDKLGYQALGKFIKYKI